MPRILSRIESPPQSVSAKYEMMDIEKITKTSVISRAAVADALKAERRLDNLLNKSLRNVRGAYETVSAIGAD